MTQNTHSIEGKWLIESSLCRCLPVCAELQVRSQGEAGAKLSVAWKDADHEAAFTREGGLLEAGRATFHFETSDGEKHLLVAALHAEPGARRKLFGFVTSYRDREETGTGAFTANDVDPDEDQDHCGDEHRRDDEPSSS